MCIRDSIVQTARSIGVSDDRIHRESFLPMSEQSSASQAFVLKLAKSGQEFSVLPGKSIVETLEAVSYTHLRAHETVLDLVCRLLLVNKKTHNTQHTHKYLHEDTMYTDTTNIHVQHTTHTQTLLLSKES